MKLLNFGSCNIDYVYTVDHIVEIGETETIAGLEIFPGGKGLNQSIAASKAGAEVYHAGCIGNDGKMLYDILVSNRVDVTNVKTVNVKNGHAIIQLSKDGENSILIFPSSNEMLDNEFIDEVIDKFSTDDMLLLQNEVNNTDYIIRRAYEKGLKIVLNPSPFNKKINTIDFNMLSYVILNEVEAKCITGRKEPEESLAILRKKYPMLKVVLTLGKKGCIYQDEEQTLYQPAFKVESVDTTAAGDTFTGYFISGINKKLSCEKALKYACAASAVAVSKKGAASSIPDKDEVNKALEYLKPYDMDKNNKIKQQRTQIYEYVEENIADATLSGLAKVLGYSVVYTGELVKKATKLSFSKLLQNVRCELSAKLLIESELSVEEIIYRVGYKNESFFRRIFKEIYGKNPNNYRNFMRGEKNDK